MKDNIDFEISFYEGLLEKKPDYVDVMIALGDAYTKKGRYREGLLIDQRILKFKPKDPTVHYNLACDYSLLGMVDESISAIDQAISMGYRDFDFMQKDSDLDSVRKDPRYEEILRKAVRKRMRSLKKNRPLTSTDL